MNEDSGYAFKTLWQEITNGIGEVGKTITDGLQVTEKTEQLNDYEDILGRLNWSEKVIGNKQSNTGFYIIGSAILLAIVGLIIYIVIKK